MKASTIRLGLRRAFDTASKQDRDLGPIAIAGDKVREINPNFLIAPDYALGGDEEHAQPIAVVLSNGVTTVSIPITHSLHVLTLGPSVFNPAPYSILRHSGARERFADYIIDVAAEFFGGGADKMAPDEMKAEFASMREAGQ